jgi:hypothetical protein
LAPLAQQQQASDLQLARRTFNVIALKEVGKGTQMQHADEQQKAPATRRRRSSRNQPDERDIVRVGTTDSQDLLPPTPEATQRLLYYFDDRGGFWRLGRLMSSHTVTRGRHKSAVILTIATVLNRQVTRNIDEIKWVQ